MREYSLTVKETLTQGLRRYHGDAKNEFKLFDLVNLRSTPSGIKPYQAVTIPLSVSAVMSYGLDAETFPFPQLFIGKKNIFILGVDRIWYVDPGNWDTLYQLTTYDAENTDNTKSISVGNAWEVMDFWDTTLFTNGVCTVIISAFDTFVGDDFKCYVFDRTPIQTMTAHKGRGLYGGFDPQTFWGTTWETFWLEWYDKNVDVGLNAYQQIQGADKLMPVGENWIWWSSIGGGDLLFLFFPSVFTTSGFISSDYGSTQPFIMEMMQKNEQGFATMPWPGEVLSMRPLGDSVIVYGRNGVARVTPIVSPSPTYSVVDLELGGLACRSAVGGDSKNHVYVDNSGRLIHLDAGGEVNPLGYKEYFYDLLGQDIIVSHSTEGSSNNKLGKFYISANEGSFILDANGLAESKQLVTSAHFYQGGTIGLGDALTEPDDIEGYVGIDTFDFNLSGLKTIEWVHIAGVETIWNEGDGINVYVAIDYRHKVGHDLRWSTTDYKAVNREGMVYFPITGVEFRLRIKVTEYEKLEVNYIEISYKHDDKRYKRGLQVNQAQSF